MKKTIVKILGGILVFISIMLHINTQVSADNIYFKGNGTKEEPYKITDAEDLVTLSKLLEGDMSDENYSYQYYQLENNIDMSSIKDFKPIGNSHTYDFEGTFDGNGYSISNLSINEISTTTNDLNIGLFGVSSGIIKNLGIIDSTFEGSNSGAIYVGSMVGTNSGVISNSYSNSKVIGYSSGNNNVAAGGLVGQSFGGVKEYISIFDSYNKGSILAKGTEENGNIHAGGIVGLNHTGDSINTLSNLYNTGTITSNGNSGGIVGSAMKSYVIGENKVIHSYNVGTVVGNTAGGIVGNLFEATTVTKSFNRGHIRSEVASGGIVGYQYKGSITNTYNEGIVEGTHATGGIGGISNRAVVTNNYNVGLVKYKSNPLNRYIGGILGEGTYSTTITNNLYIDNTLLGIGNDRNSKVGRSKEGLLSINSYKDFDFTHVWTMEDGNTPKLKFAKVNLTDMQLVDMDLLVGEVVNIGTSTPLEATTFEGNWISSSPRVASVDSYGNVTAISGGETTITYVNEDKSIVRSALVRVNELVTDLRFTSEEETISLGKVIALGVEVIPETANNKEILWTSSDNSIATVDEFGQVKGIREGNITVTATSKDGSNQIDTIKINVIDQVKSIFISSYPDNRYYQYGDELDVSGGEILVTYQSGKTKNVKLTSRMVSGYNSKKLGKQSIKVSYSGKTIAFTVVIKLNTPSLSIAPTSYNVMNIKYSKVNGAMGYRIYRSTSKNGSYQLVKDTSSKSYMDKNVVTNKNYYYKVRAYRLVSGSRVYSSYSSVKHGKTVLDKVTNVIIKKSNSLSTSILWDDVKGADGYRIYAYDNVSKKNIYLGDTAKVSFIHKNVRKGRSYTYKIRGYRLMNGTRVYGAYSKGRSIKIKH